MDIYCDCCEEECGIAMIDEGIGTYEYWGSKGVDTRMIPVSDCCNETIIDEFGNELTEDDLRDWYEKEFYEPEEYYG